MDISQSTSFQLKTNGSNCFSHNNMVKRYYNEPKSADINKKREKVIDLHKGEPEVKEVLLLKALERGNGQ